MIFHGYVSLPEGTPLNPPSIHPSHPPPLPPRGRPALPHPRRGRCAAVGHGDHVQAQVQRRQRGLAEDPGLGQGPQERWGWWG